VKKEALTKISAGIIGGAGYTGGELIRLLLNHPQVEIAFVHSNSQTGKLLYEVHTDLIGETELRFTDKVIKTDVLFLCTSHNDSRKFLDANELDANTKVIDLSQDFRLKQKSTLNGRTFAYGLPELNREAITGSANVANPGCFATCIQLALLPLAAQQQLNGEIHISATTGSTGAGQSLSETSHFSWRQNNLSVYKAFEHQHLNEIGESLTQLQKNFKGEINFIPHRGSFTRGIFASAYANSDLKIEEAKKLFKDFYSGHPFMHMSDNAVDLKQVVNTNKCLLHVAKHDGKLLITSVLDNLLKGASGQAVQNMNLVFGLQETAGLKLKASYF
jgi:N-acetyl-gamma-glutamyl-phosphate reductase